MMADFILSHYNWFMALHLIATVSWMAGMLYLPRLFVYHAKARAGFEPSATFKIMEYRLLRYIMTPAMIATFIFGGLMLYANTELLSQPWMHMKITAVVLMAGLHGFFARTVKVFARDANTYSPNFYRWINEAPTVLMIIIIIMVMVRPF